MSTPGLKLNRTQWLICAIAAIGFAFDIYELLMLPLIIKPAIAALSAPLIEELVKGGMLPADAAALWTPGGKMYVQWARTLFFVPAIAPVYSGDWNSLYVIGVRNDGVTVIEKWRLTVTLNSRRSSGSIRTTRSGSGRSIQAGASSTTSNLSWPRSTRVCRL